MDSLIHLGVEGILNALKVGKNTAGSVSNMLSSHGSKTKNEELAKSLANVTAPAGAAGMVALGFKKRQHLQKAMNQISKGDPVVNAALLTAGVLGGITAGGMGAGALTGAATSLRKSPASKKALKKEANIRRGFLQKGKEALRKSDDIARVYNMNKREE